MSNTTLKKIIDSGVKLTPMMSQYFSIKEKYPEPLLFFRMGDFYELFFEDAVEVARLLNITLTHRGKLGEFPIPMAGIPHHSASTYVDRITSRGRKVAICEQVEDPKEAKGIVKREITKIVSPGIPFDLEKTDATEYRYLSSGAYINKNFFLVLIDFTAGEFLGLKCKTEKEFLEKLSLFSPREFITSMGQWEKFPEITKYLEACSILKTYLSEEYFSTEQGSLYIEKLIPSYSRDEIIKLNKEILSPIAALSYYICSTQILNEFCHIRPFRMEVPKGKMKVTLPTLKGLEIFPKSKETYRESLLGYFDKTKTSMGTRELKYQFQTPCSSFEEIGLKHDAVDFFLKNPEGLKELREELSLIRDLQRILAKISTKKASSSDLINLSKGIFSYQKIAEKFHQLPGNFFQQISKKEQGPLKEMAERILDTLDDELGASLEKGNLIKKGSNKERDRLSQLSVHTADEILNLETKYRKLTKISNLKVKHNNISGHFIEISNSHLSKVPKNFERRQTLVNSERYITKELMEFEKEVITAKEKLEQLEKKIFNDLVSSSAALAPTIMKISRVIGILDVFQSFSWVALHEEFSRPQISPGKKIMDIKGAWHPLIKSTLKDQFVTHDLTLDKSQFFGLITGPNMAGKTTVMREMAIIQFLTQIGSFVPAREAHVGLCDYLFSRLGASDDILKGQSTFMVEMSETAEILRHATEKSLIILDEVGRGTSTFDGLSVAWALVEYFIQKIKAITLFSTHYHELIDVIEQNPTAKNLTVETIVHEGDVQFLYRLIEGGTGQSYGIFVAKLAGLPQTVLNRAQLILNSLENPAKNLQRSLSLASASMTTTTAEAPGLVSTFPPLLDTNATAMQIQSMDTLKEAQKKFQEIQLCFFSNEEIVVKEPSKTTYKTIVPEYLKNLEADLMKMDVMNMTPLQALEKLHKLQKNVQCH